MYFTILPAFLVIIIIRSELSVLERHKNTTVFTIEMLEDQNKETKTTKWN